MKVFVSGQIDDVENVRHIQTKLVEAGHTITHDWTINETGANFLSGKETKIANLEESARRARNDLNGVINCDVYIACTNNKKVGKGMYVELGSALALYETVGKPQVYTIGSRNHMSIFYLHPAVKHFDSIEELLQIP